MVNYRITAVNEQAGRRLAAQRAADTEEDVLDKRRVGGVVSAPARFTDCK